MSHIELKNITKRFGDVQALHDVSLNLAHGKIYGLLGRNGAGKTTLLNIITGRLFADSGELFMGKEPLVENDHALSNIYMMGEKTLYPENMKVSEVFKWSREFYHDFDLDYALSLAERFGLNCKKRVKSLSTGYSSIFKNIVALATNAKYILLDEPVLGLDANHRDLFYKCLIEKYAERQNTFVLSTHLIEEVSEVIENVIIIKRGDIIFDDTRDHLLSCGYAVLGSSPSVDGYIGDKHVIGTESLGGLKKAYIWGTADKKTIPADLELSSIDLQKLFIQLTNS